MACFRSIKTLQKFSSDHAQTHNHFSQERHIVSREIYRERRSAALAKNVKAETCSRWTATTTTQSFRKISGLQVG